MLWLGTDSFAVLSDFVVAYGWAGGGRDKVFRGGEVFVIALG